jgi:putative DNA primase/helicase
MGYCLTADVSEQKLPIFHGTGANGKSTLLNAFMDVVGSDYTMQAMPDFLMEKRGESHPTEKASLFGKRFVSCVETESSRKLAESTVKMLTGGEKIMARRMREDFWEFSPSHKLVLCTNHKPIVAGQDHGIWRRLLLVPFTQRFEGQRIDKALPDKLRTEAAGVLAWLVRGCMDWQRVGLNPPAIVTNATTAYRTKEDVLGRFIDDECQQGPNVSVTFASLFAKLETWSRDNGDDCPTKKSFGTWLAENGFERSRSNGVVWNGLMLSNVPEDNFS